MACPQVFRFRLLKIANVICVTWFASSYIDLRAVGAVLQIVFGYIYVKGTLTILHLL